MPIATSLDANWDQEDDGLDAMAAVLEQLAEADGDFDFGSMQKQWSRRGALSPKQACLVIWRLQASGVEHDPMALGLRVSTRDSDHEQIAGMEPWQRDRLIPYLSAEQRENFGL